MTPETPTPETNDLAVVCYGESGIEGGNGFCAVPIKECRRLERERDAARAEIEAMQEAIKSAFPAFSDLWNLCPDVPPWALDNADAALTKLKPFIRP